MCSIYYFYFLNLYTIILNLYTIILNLYTIISFCLCSYILEITLVETSQLKVINYINNMYISIIVWSDKGWKSDIVHQAWNFLNERPVENTLRVRNKIIFLYVLRWSHFFICILSDLSVENNVASTLIWFHLFYFTLSELKT